MSHIIKLGAQAITDDMMINVEKDKRVQSLAWHAGFYAGLFEAGMLTNDELDELTNELR